MKHILTMLALVLSLYPYSQALAHAIFVEKEMVYGKTTSLTIRIPHGCRSSHEATLHVRVHIPQGVIAVKPMLKAGWKIKTVNGPYKTSYEYYGHTVTEGVQEIVWSGELPDDFYDEFVFRARVADNALAGKILYFPVLQQCADEAENWVQIPAAGQHRKDLKNPAPGIMVVSTPANDEHEH